MLFTSKQSLNTNSYDFFFQFTQQQPLKGVITLFLFLFKSLLCVVYYSHAHHFLIHSTSLQQICRRWFVGLWLADQRTAAAGAGWGSTKTQRLSFNRNTTPDYFHTWATLVNGFIIGRSVNSDDFTFNRLALMEHFLEGSAALLWLWLSICQSKVMKRMDLEIFDIYAQSSENP